MTCDKIETVTVRTHRRPRQLQANTPEEATYQGTIVSDPEDVLLEFANQVCHKASSRVTQDDHTLGQECPWQDAVAHQDTCESIMLSPLLGPYGRHLFAMVIARGTDKAPGTDGITNQVWENMPIRILDKVWGYFRECIQVKYIHAALVELTTALIYKGK